MLNYLLNCESDIYHIIRISNITDRMDIQNVKKIVEYIHRCLKVNGFISGRRLLGNYILLDVLVEYFDVKYVHNRSEFYSEVMARN